MTVAPGPVVTKDPVAWSTILATDELLEVQTAGAIVTPLIVALWPVRLTVVPVEVVASARKLSVWPADVAVCEPGETVIETIGSLEDPVVAVTTSGALPTCPV